jgi:hypothetical protein
MSIIKAPKRRIKFERMLRSFGYRNRETANTYFKKINHQMLKDCYPEFLDINLVLTRYLNKKSFLYQEFLKDTHLSNKELYKKYNYLSKKIRFKEKNRIAELGWELIFYKDPSTLSDNDRRKILFRVIKELVSFYRNKNYPRSMNPNPGHILISKPWDQKLHMGMTKFPELIPKRSSLNSRCGFGNLDQYNYEIGIFDLQLKLNPI